MKKSGLGILLFLLAALLVAFLAGQRMLGLKGGTPAAAGTVSTAANEPLSDTQQSDQPGAPAANDLVQQARQLVDSVNSSADGRYDLP